MIRGAFAHWGKWNTERRWRSRAANIRNRQLGRQNRPWSELPEKLAAVVPPQLGEKSLFDQNGRIL